MKNTYGWLAILLAVCMLLFPLIPAGSKTVQGVQVMAPVENISVPSVSETFKLKGEDGITEIKADDYIFGVVEAEMPALYHIEALKAQAVAAYSFALYRKAENGGKDYDLTTDITSDQAFITVEKAREKWGDKAQEYESKIREAVAAVKGKRIVKDGNGILSVYTAISGGRTESAENVWGSKKDYLVPVESIGDLLCPDYLSSASFSADDIAAKLCTPNGISSDTTTWFGSPVHSDSGTVLSMDFGGKALSGTQIRNALSLRSANFEVVYADGVFNFSVRGYGHLVGMSQYGANYMAMQGSTYEEILKWYYTGCEIK